MPLLVIIMFLLWVVGAVMWEVIKWAWNARGGSLTDSRNSVRGNSGLSPSSSVQPSATGSSLYSTVVSDQRSRIPKATPAERRRIEARQRQQADQEEFLSIPADLRRDALFWMFKDEILQRRRAGSLELQIAHLFEVNDVQRPGSATRDHETNRRRSEPMNQESADATHDYWWAYREHGRFGSHPSHDDYSDEGAS
jgi:hypothetical protein